MPKTFTATLSKDGRQLVATVRYVETSWPESVVFEGDTEAFRLPGDEPLTLRASLGRFRETARFQASQAGATIEIRDDGGEAIQWVDEVLPP